MNPDLQAWFFDFDGTLTDYDCADGRALEVLRLAYAAAHDADRFREAAAVARVAYYRSVAKLGPREGLDRYRIASLFEAIGAPLPELAVSVYQEALRRETTATPGARELLALLKKRFRTGVITNAYDAEPQRLRVAVTGLGEFLDDVVVAADIGHFKPEPELLWAAAEQLGVAPERCVYVGDSVAFDVAAAQAAGMVAVLVSRVPPDPAITVRPHLWVPDLATLTARC